MHRSCGRMKSDKYAYRQAAATAAVPCIAEDVKWSTMRAIQIPRLDGPEAASSSRSTNPPTATTSLIDVHAAGVAFPDALQTPRALPAQAGAALHPGRRDRRRRAQRARRRARRPRRPGRRADDAHRRDGRSRCAAGGSGVQAARHGVVRGGRRAAVQRPDGALRAAHPRPAGRRARRCWCTARQAASAPRRCDWRRRSGASRTIAVVSTEDKAEVARAAGATDVVLADGFKDAVKELTDGRGVDIVVDPVGGDRFTDSLRSLAPGGRLLVIGFTGGDIPTVKVNRLLLNNVDAVGVGWGAWAAHPSRLPRRAVGRAGAAAGVRRGVGARARRLSRSSAPPRRSHRWRTAPPRARSSSRCDS